VQKRGEVAAERNGEVTKGQLVSLPVEEGRKAERRVVNLAARLREPGATLAEIDVINLSTDGFMAQVDVSVEAGSCVWLKLPGLEPQNSKVVWVEDGRAGFEFLNPLHPATLELLVSAGRKAVPKGHFGPQSGR
jgi:hypothetical protein